MKNYLLLISFLFIGITGFNLNGYAGDAKKDTVFTGIYVTSIHGIDFKQKEYTIDFWLWLKYKNRDFDFVR